MSASPDYPPEELAELAHEMRHLWHAVVRGVSQPEGLEGLQRQQFWVLGALAHGPRRMSDLAECAGTSQASLTGIVDRLEERELVERVRTAEDRRVVEVALTTRGREQMDRSNAAMLGRIAEVVEPLSTAERRQFLALLRKITSGPGDANTCT
jgi:DNA-binding MarR family transcriptional regulator